MAESQSLPAHDHPERPAANAVLDSFRPRLERMVELRLDPRLRSRIDACDVIQDAFVEVCRRLDAGSADQRMPFFVWVRFLTAQRLLQLHREQLGTEKRDAAREVALESAAWGPDASSVALARDLADSTLSPSQRASADEERGQLERALGRLKDIDREVIALRHFEQLSNGEAASVLQLSESAAAWRYVRAVERLRELVSA